MAVMYFPNVEPLVVSGLLSYSANSTAVLFNAKLNCR